MKRETFGPGAQAIVDAALGKLDVTMRAILPDYGITDPRMPAGHVSLPEVEELRAKTLALGPNAGAEERGTILAFLGSIERAEILIHRIDAERHSVNRQNVLARARLRSEGHDRPVEESGYRPARA